MVYAPNVFHAILTTVAQVFFFKFTKKRYGGFIAYFTLILLWINNVMTLYLMRTFSNSIETCLLMIGLYFWEKIPHGSTTKGYLIKEAIILTALITFSFVIRNSSAVAWLPLLIYKVFY